MPTILKKFKEKVEHLLSPGADDQKIDFENQTVTLDGQDYLFCRAVVSSIPEMLSVERAVYNGKTPINYAVFEKQIQDVANQLVLLVRFEDPRGCICCLQLCSWRSAHHGYCNRSAVSAAWNCN